MVNLSDIVYIFVSQREKCALSDANTLYCSIGTWQKYMTAWSWTWAFKAAPPTMSTVDGQLVWQPWVIQRRVSLFSFPHNQPLYVIFLASFCFICKIPMSHGAQIRGNHMLQGFCWGQHSTCFYSLHRRLSYRLILFGCSFILILKVSKFYGVLLSESRLFYLVHLFAVKSLCIFPVDWMKHLPVNKVDWPFSTDS